jgi:hypothetical protein
MLKRGQETGGSVFDSLVGTSSVRITVEHGASVDAILASKAPAIARWRAEIRPFLLYPPGRRVAIERNVDMRIAALVDRRWLGVCGVGSSVLGLTGLLGWSWRPGRPGA